MDIHPSSSQTTLAILLGASEWPDSADFPGSKAFANAVASFKSYLFDFHMFGLPKENVLDLFNVDDSPHVIDRKIRQFLERRIEEMKQAGNDAKDLLVYFVGHGGFTGRNADYYLAIRCTSTENARLSAIPMESLASTLIDKARYLRRIIILDCCYSAAAFTTFQTEGPAKLGIDQTFDAFEKKTKTVGKGTALLCSSGKTVASQIAQDGSCTLFSKALLQVLYVGDERQRNKQYLSLREVADLTEEVIDTKLEGKAPRPEVHSPDQREGEVADVPFFPNLAVLQNRPQEQHLKDVEIVAKNVGIVVDSLRRTGQSQTAPPLRTTSAQLESTPRHSSGSLRWRHLLGFVIYLISAYLIGSFETQLLRSNHMDLVLARFFGINIDVSTLLFLVTLVVLFVVLALFDLLPRSIRRSRS